MILSENSCAKPSRFAAVEVLLRRENEVADRKQTKGREADLEKSIPPSFVNELVSWIGLTELSEVRCDDVQQQPAKMSNE